MSLSLHSYSLSLEKPPATPNPYFLSLSPPATHLWPPTSDLSLFPSLSFSFFFFLFLSLSFFLRTASCSPPCPSWSPLSLLLAAAPNAVPLLAGTCQIRRDKLVSLRVATRIRAKLLRPQLGFENWTRMAYGLTRALLFDQ